MGVAATLPELSECTITICSQFKVLMTIFFTKCISLFASDYQFLYYALKQCLSALGLIRAHWGILYCSSLLYAPIRDRPRVDRLRGDTCPYVCPQTGLD